MKKYTFLASSIFKDLIDNFGVEYISDKGICKEAEKNGIILKNFKSWEYDNGIVNVYVEED